MKFKVTIILIICISISVFVGCNNTSPSTVAANFLTEVKEGNNTDINNYLNTQIDKTQSNTTLINNNTDLEYDLEYAVENMFKRIEFNILEENSNGKSATVTLELKSTNWGSLLSQFFKEGVVPTFTDYYNPELIQNNLMLLLIDKINKSTNETKTIKINLSKSKGDWSIEKNDSLYDSLLGILD